MDIRKIVMCLFIVFLVCGITSLFTVEKVSAFSDVYHTGFEASEGGIPGSMYTNSWITSTYKTSGTAEVSSSNPHTGTRSYYFTGATSLNMYMNLTYPANCYLSGFSFWSKKILYDANPISLYFINRTFGVIVALDSYSNVFRYYDYAGASHYISGGDGFNNVSFTVVDNQTIEYRTGTTLVIDTPRGITSDNTNWHIDQIRIFGTAVSGNTLYLDDFNLSFSDSFAGPLSPPPVSDTTIYINAYDTSSGNLLDWYGKNFIGPLYTPGANFVQTYITSDLWPGDFLDHLFTTSPLTINTTFAVGSLHSLTFSYPAGFVDGEAVNWYNKTEYFYWYPNQEYSFYFTRVGDIQYANEYCTQLTYGGNWWRPAAGPFSACLAVDKYVYQAGESVLCRYTCPTPIQLQALQMATSGYYVCFQRDAGLWPLNPGIGDSITGTYSGISIPQPATLDGGDHFFQFTPPTPTDNIDNYDVYICSASQGWFGALGPNYIIGRGHVKFTLYSGGVFTPSGNITSISPSEPSLGQKVTIAFNANNNGKIKIKQINGTEGKYVWEVPFTKPITPSSIANTSYQPSSFGPYAVEEYVWDGLNYTQVSTAFFFVNLTGSLPGEFGTAEFLYPSPHRVIAGADTLLIIYHSLVDGAWITITDPYGAISPYSTVVNTVPGVLEIKVPSYYEVGMYTVVMNATKTISTNFSVIAMENNWVEFHSGQPYEGIPFTLLIEHTEKVSILFFKDGQQIGEPIYLEKENLSQGFYEIPLQLISPTKGNWKVELWEINNFIPYKKLAEYTCRVVVGPVVRTAGPVVDVIKLIPSEYRVYIAIGIIVGFVLMPFIVISRLGASLKRTKGIELKIPESVYTVSCSISGITGYCVTLLMGFLEWWTVFVVTFFLALILVIMYLMKKQGSA